MNRLRTLWVAGMLSAALCAASAFAQEEGGRGPRGPGRGGPGGMFGGGPGGPGGNLTQLATDEQVQKELGVSEEQAGYLKLLRDESRDEDRKFFESMRDSDVPREERFEKFRAYQEKRVTEVDGQIKEIIGDDKLKRLKQIRLQATGPMALMSPEIAKEVGLTEDQKTKLQEAIREQFGRMRFGGGPGGPGGPPPGEGSPPPRGEGEGGRGGRGPGGPGGPGGREQFEAMRKDLEKKFTEVLTDKQKERWTALLGEPAKIDFDKLREAQRGDRGRGGERGGERRRDRQNSGSSET